MPRPILDESAIHPAVRAQVAAHNAAIVAEVQAALAAHPVVVVGMSGNPFVRKVRRRLDGAGVAHHDLDYGGYLSDWRRRSALKMWSGWPTYPMVFVRGQLVGGADDVQRLIDSGALRQLLA